MTLKIYTLSQLPEYSHMMVLKLEPSFDGEDVKAFVCSNDILCREPIGSCIQGQPVGRYVPVGESPNPTTLIETPPFYALPEYTIYPNRVLQTIASIEDMEEYTDDPGTNPYNYYRADTVAMIFYSEQLRDQAIDLIVDDLVKHTTATSKVFTNPQIITADAYTDSDTRDYFFQG